MLKFFGGGSGSVVPVIDNKCHLKKDIIENVNASIGVLGPPGAGKSSFCNAYYKIRFNTNKMFFEMSSSTSSYTKGIWMLKEEERMKIPQNIDRDILDVEGFQVDDINSWKYVMIISFICSEIIILNRNTRWDDSKKVLNIIKNSLKKMKESNIPKILKKIYIQLDDEDEIAEFNKKLEEIGYAHDSIPSITIIPLYLPSFDKTTLKKYKKDVMNIPEYMENLEKVFKELTLNENEQSISTFIKYIDNLNMALDGKMNFDAQGIIKDLENEYNVCYETWYNQKKNQLLKLDLTDIEDIDETFDSYVDRQNLDFSFAENLEELTFYGSSDEFDKYYKSFGKNKEFQVNKDIFYNTYENKKSEKQIQINRLGNEKQQKLGELESYYIKIKRKIDTYFGNLVFYSDIDSKYKHCNMDISIDLDDEKSSYLQKLYEYYDKKIKDIKAEWESQITRAKFKSKCQCEGRLECKNGHQLNGDCINCGKCNGKLYWVDGPTHHYICENCEIINILTSTVCASCGAEVYCKPKFTSYRP